MKTIKIIFIIGILLLLIGLILFFINDKEKVDNNGEIAILGIDIVQTEISLKYDETLKLYVMFYPSDATKTELIWKSSDSDLVSVDSDGNVKANEEKGSAIITVSTKDGIYIDTVVVNVVDPKNPSDNQETIIKDNGCTLSVSNGKIGLNNWYISDVTLSLKTNGSTASEYGITTTINPSYNNKEKITISDEHSSKRYYGHVKYKDGTLGICSISLKIDKTKPLIPTSVVKKNNKNGETVTDSSSYKNYKMWWGNYNSIDNVSGIDHYEYSTDCKNKTDNLKSEYIFPLDGKNFYNKSYCIRSVDKAGNYSDWSDNYSFNIDIEKPTCSVSIATGSSKDTLTVTATDSHSEVLSYSYNNSDYSTSNTYKINKGTKVTVSVKDKAGNIGECKNYRTALILLGDSRTNILMQDLNAKKVLTKYDNIYFSEKYDNGSKEVYAVAKNGASISWLLGKNDNDSSAYQVQFLMEHLSKRDIYYDIKIASNLGVNDINKVEAESSANNYISRYDKLLKSSERVNVDNKEVDCSWKKSGNIIGVNFYFISINPIDEKQINECKPSNQRTEKAINQFNQIMKTKYGSKYIDSNSKFDDWFSQATKNGEFRFESENCDGLHYSKYLNTNFIYPFYKKAILG